MKRLLVVILVVAAVSTAAFAQGAPRKGAFGIQTAVIITTSGFGPGASGSLGAKYMVTDAIGLRAALGILNSSSGGASTTGYDLGAGFEYHLAGKGGVSPYLGAELGYSGASFSGGGTTPSSFAVNAVFGAEYFFSSNFSWGGEAQLGFNSFTTAGGVTTTSLGTGAVSFIMTWYVN
jgi:hypothetical protein